MKNWRQVITKRVLNIILAITISIFGLTQTGCASGGFKLTRDFAGFVNKQNTIIRVVLYIVTIPVFVATVVIDMVVFNTMDFWEGRVSANAYEFERDGLLYAVSHYYEGEQNLRNTKVRVYDSANTSMPAKSIVHISEISAGKINIYENDQLKATVESISDLPRITLFEAGKAKPWKSPELIALK